MLSEAALKEFKQLYLEEFGKEISDEKATELGINLLTLFQNIYRPVKKEWAEKLVEKIKQKYKNQNQTQSDK
jgi:hypothetical protein